MANVTEYVCPKCKSGHVTLQRPSQLLLCNDCSTTFTKLESSLTKNYPNLCTFVGMLVQKAKSPKSSMDERKTSELVLKDVRILVENATGRPLPRSIPIDVTAVLGSKYLNLLRFATLLLEKAGSPISSQSEKEEAELILKDIRALAGRLETAKVKQHVQERPQSN